MNMLEQQPTQALSLITLWVHLRTSLSVFPLSVKRILRELSNINLKEIKIHLMCTVSECHMAKP